LLTGTLIKGHLVECIWVTFIILAIFI